jgi:hypothetical protein
MTSVREILGHVPEHETLSRAIREGMGQALNASFVESPLTAEEISLAGQIAGREIPLRKEERK